MYPLSAEARQPANSRKLALVAFLTLSRQPSASQTDPRRHGTAGRITAWIRSFLQGRHSAVVEGGQIYGYVPTETEVPQRSVPGPCLFLLYANDFIHQTQLQNLGSLLATPISFQKTIHTGKDQQTLKLKIPAT